MSDGRFKYLPGVTLQCGDTEAGVHSQWINFVEFNREFAALRFDYSESTPRPGRHDRCTEAEKRPLLSARIEHFDRYGYLSHITTPPNLLAPQWFNDPRFEGLSLTRPGYIENEIGDAA